MLSNWRGKVFHHPKAITSVVLYWGSALDLSLLVFQGKYAFESKLVVSFDAPTS